MISDCQGSSRTEFLKMEYPPGTEFLLETHSPLDSPFCTFCQKNLSYWSAQNLYIRQRPYRNEYTGSLPNSEVNRCRARSVLGWGTAREALRVLLAFCKPARFKALCKGQHSQFLQVSIPKGGPRYRNFKELPRPASDSGLPDLF